MKKFYYLVAGIGIMLVTIIACEKSSIGVDELQTLQKEEVLLSKGEVSRRAEKSDICHLDADSGEYFIINIADAAYDKHIAHGDYAPVTYYEDADGDGDGNPGVYVEGACEAPDGYVGNSDDCDDTNAAINPGATEICGNGIDDNCNGETDENCGPKIGDIREGGVVFYIANEPIDLDGDGNADIGLVVALSDFANRVEWGCFGTDLPTVPNVTTFPPSGPGAEIGDGMSNTNAIIADCSSAPAALAARSYGDDWFLPSINELNEMYVNRVALQAVDGFTAFGSFYWSSTEIGSITAWVRVFGDGRQNGNGKTNTGSVRAVRAF